MEDAQTGFPLLDSFRALVRREVEAAIKRDGYHKRFEEQVDYHVELPPVVDWSEMPDPLQRQPGMKQKHVLQLYCYVIGPSRSYQWSARRSCRALADAALLAPVGERRRNRPPAARGR